MKFSTKIFLMAFILIIVIVNFIGVFLINNSFKTSIEQEVTKNIVVANNIASITATKIIDIPIWVNTYLLDEMYTKIYLNEEVIFTNFPEGNILAESKIENNLDDKVNSYIVDKKLYTAVKKDEYLVITCSIIEDVYEEKERIVDYFIKLSLLSSIGASLILSLLVGIITRKLKKLTKVAVQIEKGNYDVLIPKLGNDEIGGFARTFASMTNSINQNIQEIEKISENRKIFIGNLTHEIRTPLTSIIGYSSLIKNGKVTDIETINNYIYKIYEEGKYIEELRDKLMGLLTFETAKIILEKKDIQDLLLNLIKGLKEIYPDVIFETFLNPVMVNVDVVLFKSLIFNLVKNGIRAAKNPIITFKLDNKSLVILDNGKGIPSEELEKIKEPFYTLNKDRNRQNSGLGLGIPLCLEIIKIHHWQFYIESKVNKGTKVIIEWRDND